MSKVTARSGIKLKVPKALTEEEFANPSIKNSAQKSVTLYMNKKSILNLRKAYENAIKRGVKKFPFDGNHWLTAYAETALLELEREAKRKNWL
jgi:hypothetical protein